MTFPLVSVLRNTTDPSAAAPCSWTLILAMDASSFQAQSKLTPSWRISMPSGRGRPSIARRPSARSRCARRDIAPTGSARAAVCRPVHPAGDLIRLLSIRAICTVRSTAAADASLHNRRKQVLGEQGNTRARESAKYWRGQLDSVLTNPACRGLTGCHRGDPSREFNLGARSVWTG